MVKIVVPHAGTWIEIGNIAIPTGGTVGSFPTRERGLKLNLLGLVPRRNQRRSPRGNVD